MKSISKILLLTVFASFVFSSGLAQAKEELPEVTEDGLHRVHDSKLSVVYVEPGASLSGYDKVILLEPYIAFKKNWQRDQNRTRGIGVSDKDMERIKKRLATEFHDVFAETLSENDGYPIVTENGEDVLIVRPAIINLDATAPDTMSAGRSRTYAADSGEMTLYIEIYDGPTGDLMAKALDRQVDRQTGYVTWQTSASNTQAARRILKSWAQVMRDGLDEAHAAGSAGSD